MWTTSTPSVSGTAEGMPASTILSQASLIISALSRRTATTTIVLETRVRVATGKASRRKIAMTGKIDHRPVSVEGGTDDDEPQRFASIVSAIAFCGFALLAALTAPFWWNPVQDWLGPLKTWLPMAPSRE